MISPATSSRATLRPTCLKGNAPSPSVPTEPRACPPGLLLTPWQTMAPSCCRRATTPYLQVKAACARDCTQQLGLRDDRIVCLLLASWQITFLSCCRSTITLQLTITTESVVATDFCRGVSAMQHARACPPGLLLTPWQTLPLTCCRKSSACCCEMLAAAVLILDHSVNNTAG